MIKIGIIGAGNSFAVSHFHAKAINQNDDCEITAILSKSLNNSERFKQEYCPKANICIDLEDFFRKVDAVCICSPNNTHAHYAIEAIKAGKAILCEKPVGGTLEEIEQLKECTLGTDVVNVVGYNYRYQRPFKIIKDLVSLDELGELYWYNEQKGGNRLANRNIPFEWRMSRASIGGATMDFCSHMVDHFCFISGLTADNLKLDSIKRRVYIPERKNTAGENVYVETEDYTLLSLTALDKISINLTASRVGIPDEQIEVVGSKGMVKYSSIYPDELLFYRITDGGYSTEPIKKHCMDDLQKTYNTQMNLFVDAIINKKQLRPNLIDGCEIFKLLYKAIYLK